VAAITASADSPLPRVKLPIGEPIDGYFFFELAALRLRCPRMSEQNVGTEVAPNANDVIEFP
jgi:hypothetical protein